MDMEHIWNLILIEWGVDTVLKINKFDLVAQSRKKKDNYLKLQINILSKSEILSAKPSWNKRKTQNVLSHTTLP